MANESGVYSLKTTFNNRPVFETSALQTLANTQVDFFYRINNDD